MNDYIISLICFVLILVVSFIIFMIINLRLVNKKEYYKILGMEYLVNKFNLNKAKVSFKKIAITTSVINSFIIAFVATIVYMIPLKLFFQLGIGFVLLIILIYAIYEIYGRFLHKKWGSKK